jgi:glycosyltransferase involved in cell wall biosynthesis
LRLRVVDYVANLGGGIRFSVELCRGIRRNHPEAELELVSYGSALRLYRRLLRDSGTDVEIIELKPENYWISRVSMLSANGLIPKLPVSSRLRQYYTSVPNAALDGCDAIWLPWVHRHRILNSPNCPVIGSLHDIIHFQVKNGLSDSLLRADAETTRQWLDSKATIVVSSRATQSALTGLFGVQPERVSIITLAGEHSRNIPHAPLPGNWSWVDRPYLLCPSNTGVHKNHEVLIEGFAGWGAIHPLVLTGRNTDLLRDPFGGWRFGRRSRKSVLRKLAESQGLVLGRDLMPLGYTSDGVYKSLLDRAWALVMPTLAEGGGSFPVWEALFSGIPVICSDIPVMREMIERVKGEVVWFDPYDSMDLVRALKELETNYRGYKVRALEQVNQLHDRTWNDVASDYWDLMLNAGIKAT